MLCVGIGDCEGLQETQRAGLLPTPCSVNMAGGIKRLHTETKDRPTETNLQ